MKYITWLNTLLDEIYYWMKYITGWNTLHVLDEIHYLMKYITGWNTLLDEIYYLMKYITWWNTLLYETHYVIKVAVSESSGCYIWSTVFSWLNMNHFIRYYSEMQIMKFDCY